MGRQRLVTGLQSLLGRRSCFSVSRIQPNNACGIYGNYGFTNSDSRNDGRDFGKETKQEFASPRRFVSQGHEMSTMAHSIELSGWQYLSRPNSLTRGLSRDSSRSAAAAMAKWGTILMSMSRTGVRIRSWSGLSSLMSKGLGPLRAGAASAVPPRPPPALVATDGVSRSMSTDAQDPGERISVTFVDKDGDESRIQVPVGMSMLEAAHENAIELEGACEGSLACSTCHVIVMDEEMYDKLPEPSDEENDMLDLAFGLTETSRLGCQVIAQPELDGLHLALPAATRNFAVDGHVPKPH